MRTVVRVLNGAEARVMRPHIAALNEAREGVRLTAILLEPRMATGAVKFDLDTLCYYRDDPDPPATAGAAPDAGA